MKTCAYCGQANDDAAIVCGGCGTGEFRPPPIPTTPTPGAEPSEAAYRLREIAGDPVRLFRALVLLATVSYVVWFFHLLPGRAFVSRDTLEALSWDGASAVLRIPTSVSWLTMLVFVAVSVGLWHFSKSARLVFTLFLAFFALLGLLCGVRVETAYGSFLNTLGTMADGAILVLAFTPPLKDRFA